MKFYCWQSIILCVFYIRPDLSKKQSENHDIKEVKNLKMEPKVQLKLTLLCLKQLYETFSSHSSEN